MAIEVRRSAGKRIPATLDELRLSGRDSTLRQYNTTSAEKEDEDENDDEDKQEDQDYDEDKDDDDSDNCSESNVTSKAPKMKVENSAELQEIIGEEDECEDESR
ncbi:hypothetical protein PYCC9005_005189 [Savitreella phatthalungensis]